MFRNHLPVCVCVHVRGTIQFSDGEMLSKTRQWPDHTEPWDHVTESGVYSKDSNRFIKGFKAVWCY